MTGRRLACALLLAVAATACSTATSADAPSAGTPADAPTAATAPPAADAGAHFPVKISHRYGTTEIPAEPDRVVALGFQEQDALLALGIRPVAVRYWFGDHPDAIFPWAADAATTASGPVEEIEVLHMPFGELDLEKIAALDPDLISAVYAGITEEEYARLSEIAPTITQTDAYVDFGMPWQEMTVMVGRAVGREDQARRAVEEVEAQFAAARDQHEAFVGATIAVASGPGEGSDQYSIYGSQDARSRVFTLLGFEIAEDLEEIAADQFYATISREQVDLLDRDLLVFHQMQWVAGGRQALEQDPLLSQLDVMRDGRVVYVGGELDDALQFSTVLSLPHLLDELVPLLADALAP